MSQHSLKKMSVLSFKMGNDKLAFGYGEVLETNMRNVAKTQLENIPHKVKKKIN